MLRHAPEPPRELQLGDHLLQRRGNVVTGLEVNQADESPLKLARVRAPVQIGLRPSRLCLRWVVSAAAAGAGGPVTVTNGTGGTILTQGVAAFGIFAQSVGGGGGEGSLAGTVNGSLQESWHGYWRQWWWWR